MTKSNGFILNSDFLSLAQTDTNNFTAFFQAENFSAGYSHDRTKEFKTSYSPGAIDMFLVSINDSEYILGAKVTISRFSPTVSISIRRTAPQTIQVRLHVYTSQPGGYNMPAQTVKVRIASFKPPNVF